MITRKTLAEFGTLAGKIESLAREAGLKVEDVPGVDLNLLTLDKGSWPGWAYLRYGKHPLLSIDLKNATIYACTQSDRCIAPFRVNNFGTTEVN